MLNRARKSQVEQLSQPDQQLLEAYHQVYRRDRRLQATQRTKCSTPTSAQLEEMAEKLEDKGIRVTETKQIFFNFII